MLEGSRNKSYDSQHALVASYAQKTGVSYEVPHFLDAAVCIILEYVQLGTRLYGGAYTRCQEKYIDCQVAVGGFSSEGLYVDFCYGNSNIGVGCSRKL